MKVIVSRRSLSFPNFYKKSRFKYSPLKIEKYCVEDTMNTEFLAPKQVFLIATKGNVIKIVDHLTRDFNEENANIGDNFYFCQVRNYDEVIDAVSRFRTKMNIIPIYFDKEEKGIQKFIDEQIPNDSFLKLCKFVFVKVDYKNEDYNIYVMKELNEMDNHELASQIFTSTNVEWESKWKQIVSENPEYFNKK